MSLRAGAFQGAIRDFQASLAGSRRPAITHQLIGRCYARLGDKGNARRHFETALELYERSGSANEMQGGPMSELDDLKAEVAKACRIIGRLHLTREPNGHVSVRIPGTEHVLIKARGPMEAPLSYTTPDDLAMAEALIGPGAPTIRIGNGYDLHRLVPGRPLILGGVVIPFDKGLHGHSDADAVCHAVTDAILGAAGAGDIGRHFPDTDPAWKDASSIDLLRRAASVMRDAGYSIANIDVVVIAQKPKLVPFLDAMIANLAAALGCTTGQISVKGKTNEGLDSMGAGESIAVHAVALVAK